MKKKVKQYVQQTQTGGKNRDQVLKEFSRVLDDQVRPPPKSTPTPKCPCSVVCCHLTDSVHISFFLVD